MGFEGIEWMESEALISTLPQSTVQKGSPATAVWNRSTFILPCCHNLPHSSVARIAATALLKHHLQDAEEVRVLRSGVKPITFV